MGRSRIDRSRASKERRRAESEARLVEWQKLSVVEQLKALDERLGKDMGATRQRARLAKRLKD